MQNTSHAVMAQRIEPHDSLDYSPTPPWATRALCEQVKFDNAFIFRYSKRRNTPAAEIEDGLQISERVKEERNQDLLALVDKYATERNEGLVGQRVEILCEGPSRRNVEKLVGRTRTNKIVIFDGDRERLTGGIFDVEIKQSTGHTLYGDAMLAVS